MKTLIKSLSFIASFICAITICYGQGNIFSNNIDGVNPNYPNLADPFTNGQVVDPNISVSGIGIGPGISNAFYDNLYSAIDWNDVPFDNQYFEFTITPDSGYEIDFDSFEFTCEKTHIWLDSFAVRSSVDGYTSNIGTPTVGSNTIDLSSASYQNISGAITFRIYAWGQASGNGAFGINDFAFKGTVAVAPCSATVIWNGIYWNSTNSLTKTAIINANYDTTNGGPQVSFSACRLIVNNGATLTISDGDYVEIQNDITVNSGGAIIVRPKGAVVQIDDTGTVLDNGSIKVEKITAPMHAWYEYTYWSAPVSGEKIEDGLAESDNSRRFWFDASKFLDATKETGNDNATEDGQDDIDDNNNDWQYASANTIMEPGVGYATTHDEAGFIGLPGQPLPFDFKYIFEGPFNTGIITVPIYRNDEETEDNNWNLLGNPYPSAIDVDAFLAANTSIDTNVVSTQSLDGAIFLWSQKTAPSNANNGNQNSNFDTSDYAIINGTGATAGGDEVIPNRHIPSGQSFFISMSDTAPSTFHTVGDPDVPENIVKTNVIFNNAMRVKGSTNNSQFFRAANKLSKTKNSNKLWINLTSDNGIFNQTVIGYVPGATNNYDGTFYDAPRNLSTVASAIIYTTIENSNKKFAIQGKAENSITQDEMISLGFKTSIDVATIYTLSVAQFEGDFLNNNGIYIKDNLLNIVHELKASNYSFTSEEGEFNERFIIAFNSEALSTDENSIKNDDLSIIEQQNGDIQFKFSGSSEMRSIQIIDLQGRELHNLNANGNSKTYSLSNLSRAPYIAKVTLKNGAVISKKAIKKY
jgi:hypothetical protein